MEKITKDIEDVGNKGKDLSRLLVIKIMGI
jgi:hypothetical protein